MNKGMAVEKGRERVGSMAIAFKFYFHVQFSRSVLIFIFYWKLVQSADAKAIYLCEILEILSI